MSTSVVKERLDKMLVLKGLAATREKAQALIMAGKVLVDERMIDKPGTFIGTDGEIRITEDDNPFVSRGGLKLKGALEAFSLNVTDLVALDVGASTGGFTDCLLQAGAKKVYALDVGYSQLAWKLRTDKRVHIIERTNIRHYDGSAFQEPIDLAVIDTSFISLRLVIPATIRFLRPRGQIIALIKPQFEAGRKEVGKHGVVRDPETHKRVVTELISFSTSLDLTVKGTCESPLRGPKGNREFFLLAVKNN